MHCALACKHQHHAPGRVLSPDGPMGIQGVCTWSNGDQYDGEWQNSCMHGRCVCDVRACDA